MVLPIQQFVKVNTKVFSFVFSFDEGLGCCTTEYFDAIKTIGDIASGVVKYAVTSF